MTLKRIFYVFLDLIAIGLLANLTDNKPQTIRDHCARQWPQDFSMRAYCERRQWQGVRELNR